jgi:hypothetical protein
VFPDYPPESIFIWLIPFRKNKMELRLSVGGVGNRYHWWMLGTKTVTSFEKELTII